MSSSSSSSSSPSRLAAGVPLLVAGEDPTELFSLITLKERREGAGCEGVQEREGGRAGYMLTDKVK